MKIYKNIKSDEILFNIIENEDKILNEDIVEIIPGTVDAAREKHIPVVNARKLNDEVIIVNVKIGEISHPMEDTHYIQFVILETEKSINIKYLKPEEKPEVEFITNEKIVAVYEYCNLHGLWKNENI